LLQRRKPTPALTICIGLSQRQRPYAVDSVRTSSNSRFCLRCPLRLLAVSRAVESHRLHAIVINGGSALSKAVILHLYLCRMTAAATFTCPDQFPLFPRSVRESSQFDYQFLICSREPIIDYGKKIDFCIPSKKM